MGRGHSPSPIGRMDGPEEVPMYVYTVKLTLTVEDASTHAIAATIVQDAIVAANKQLREQRFPTRVTVEDINVSKKRDQ